MLRPLLRGTFIVPWLECVSPPQSFVHIVWAELPFTSILPFFNYDRGVDISGSVHAALFKGVQVLLS